MKTELQLSVTPNGSIEQNVHAFCTDIKTQCGEYEYEVTAELLDKATKDRTLLNKVLKTIQDKRKETEKELMANWNPLKKELMDTEKVIEATSKKIGEQINGFEEKVKLEKMESIKKNAMPVIQALNEMYHLKIEFEQLYVRNEYDKKSMTEKKILEDMQNKVNKIKEDMMIIDTFLPVDEMERLQVLDVYSKTLTVFEANKHAMYLKNVKEQAEETVKKQQEEKTAQEPSKTEEITQRMVFEITAKRSFFDDMNQLILKHKPQVKVITKETVGGEQ